MAAAVSMLQEAGVEPRIASASEEWLRSLAEARLEVRSKPLGDIAHIGHAELLTPEADRSLGFFTQVLGMEEEARRPSPSTCAAGAITSATA